MLNSYFLYIIGGFQFLKKLARDDIYGFNQIENKENLFSLLIGKRFKVTLRRAFAVLETIENYFSHKFMLA